jgi:hypothetical protein
MSHFQSYVCKVDNVDYVKKALKEMGLSYKENVSIVDWAKQVRKVQLAVVQDGKLLPLGFSNEEKELKLYADWYLTSFSEKSFTEQVAQLHDKHRVLDLCQQNNWFVNEEDITVSEKGELEIFATQWA